MIAIIKGCGANIASIQYAIKRLNKKSVLTSNINTIKSASHVILPGVGTAHHAMSNLQKLRLIDVIRECKQPVLGICLGMQLLYNFSSEGNVACLKLFSEKITKLPSFSGLSIPHMGWNKLKINKKSYLFNGIENNSYVYFVHSFVAPITNQTIAQSQHGIPFCAASSYKNFYGVQFHPEKSGKIGEKILKNFLEIQP